MFTSSKKEQKEKGLSTGEKKMLLNARQILVSELALVESSSQDEVENLVDNTMLKSFKEFRIESAETQGINKCIPFNNEDANVG